MVITIFITFVITILSFQINHQIKKYNDIRIIINTLFELYGNYDSFVVNDIKEINQRLSNEILGVEKQHDSNSYVTEQMDKLRTLRLLYFKYSHSPETTPPQEEIEKAIKEINFKRLKRGFTLLAYLNIKP